MATPLADSILVVAYTRPLNSISKFAVGSGWLSWGAGFFSASLLYSLVCPVSLYLLSCGFFSANFFIFIFFLPHEKCFVVKNFFL